MVYSHIAGTSTNSVMNFPVGLPTGSTEWESEWSGHVVAPAEH